MLHYLQGSRQGSTKQNRHHWLNNSFRIVGFHLLCAWSLVSCSSAVSNTEESTIDPNIELNLQAIPIDGQGVKIRSTLFNKSGEDIYFLPWSTPLTQDGQLTSPVFTVHRIPQKAQHTQQGTAVPYLGIQIKRRPPTDSDYIKLERGAQLTTTLNISTSYDFCQAGTYTITYLGGLPLQPTLHKQDTLTVQTNTITVTLTAPCS